MEFKYCKTNFIDELKIVACDQLSLHKKVKSSISFIMNITQSKIIIYLKIVTGNEAFQDKLNNYNLFNCIIFDENTINVTENASCLAYADQKILKSFKQEPTQLVDFLSVSKFSLFSFKSKSLIN